MCVTPFATGETLSGDEMTSMIKMGSSNTTDLSAWPLFASPVAGSASVDLFMIVFASSFLLVAAAVLRLAPWARAGNNGGISRTSTTGTTRWRSRRGLIISTSETDAIRSYTPFSYGALPPTHAMVLSSDLEGDITSSTTPSYETLLEIGELLGVAKQGLTDDQIRVLPTYRVRDDDCTALHQDDPNSHRVQNRKDRAACAICRDELAHADLVRVLPCGDEFHADCIAPWLKQQATCPLCRSRFA